MSSYFLRQAAIPIAVGASAAAVFVLLCVAGCASHASPDAPLAVYPPADYNFGSAPESIREEFESIDAWYQLYFNGMSGTAADRSYGLALANQTLGIVRNDPTYIARAHGLYKIQQSVASDPRQREIAAIGAKYTDELLHDTHPENTMPDLVVEPIVYVKDPPPAQFHRLILGRSTIHVRSGTRIKTQVDRVMRDWLLGHNVKGCPWNFNLADHATWHEGEKIRELIEYANANVSTVWGTHARKVNGHWYAPDDTGAPRFEISPDKVDNYPTTLVIDSKNAIINETHGISALAWDSLNADLVVGCGDHKGKMDASYWLAEHGVNVYAPTDRFMGTLIGAHTKGQIIGSAPIHKTADGAMIGGQAVTIDVDEPIVVSMSTQRYPLQYYDTPKRYFQSLAQYCGHKFNIIEAPVIEYGKAMTVVDTARERNAKVLGIRVKSKEEHDAVAAWLAEDRSRRAVLFHTAVYPDGYKLFFEFPNQTGFGDIHPVFE